MDAPSQSIAQEARQLNVRIEKEGDEWIAVLPAHPDLANDEELGLPAGSEQEALDEARAYRSIEQSSVYKFDYLEDRDVYTVRFGDQSFEGKLLAKTYAQAQEAYAKHINKPEPPKPEPAPPPTEKQPRKRRNQGHDATGRSIQGGEVTSGIGPGPAQLPAPRDPATPLRAVPGTHPIDQQLQRGALHQSAYDYLQPSDLQKERMRELREAAKAYSQLLERELPDGPDKTHTLRLHRTTAMWANVTITREPDGAPRS